MTKNQNVCSGYAFLHPTPPPPPLQKPKQTRNESGGKEQGVSWGILWLCYSLKTKEKGRGVCGNQKCREDERLRNVSTQKINKSMSNKKN